MKLNPQIVAMLDFAKTHFENLGIITNGHGEHQRNKIKTLGLEKWISRDLIIISGEHGCPKPDKRLFEIAQKKSGKSSGELLIIGDSFQNDKRTRLAHNLDKSLWGKFYATRICGNRSFGDSGNSRLTSNCIKSRCRLRPPQCFRPSVLRSRYKAHPKP